MENTHMSRNSSDYVMTIKADDPSLAGIVANIRRTIKAYNARRRAHEIESPEFVEFSWSGKQEVRRRAYIRVRGRLGKDSPHAGLYRQGGPLHRYSSQEIRVEHSERVDIYVAERRHYVDAN
jgi:hypothetical protein